MIGSSWYHVWVVMFLVAEMNGGREKVYPGLMLVRVPPHWFTVIQLISVHRPLQFRKWKMGFRRVWISVISRCEIVRPSPYNYWGN